MQNLSGLKVGNYLVQFQCAAPDGGTDTVYYCCRNLKTGEVSTFSYDDIMKSYTEKSTSINTYNREQDFGNLLKLLQDGNTAYINKCCDNLLILSRIGGRPVSKYSVVFMLPDYCFIGTIPKPMLIQLVTAAMKSAMSPINSQLNRTSTGLAILGTWGDSTLVYNDTTFTFEFLSNAALDNIRTNKVFSKYIPQSGALYGDFQVLSEVRTGFYTCINRAVRGSSCCILNAGVLNLLRLINNTHMKNLKNQIFGSWRATGYDPSRNAWYCTNMKNGDARYWTSTELKAIRRPAMIDFTNAVFAPIQVNSKINAKWGKKLQGSYFNVYDTALNERHILEYNVLSMLTAFPDNSTKMYWYLITPAVMSNISQYYEKLYAIKFTKLTDANERVLKYLGDDVVNINANLKKAENKAKKGSNIFADIPTPLGINRAPGYIEPRITAAMKQRLDAKEDTKPKDKFAGISVSFSIDRATESSKPKAWARYNSASSNAAKGNAAPAVPVSSNAPAVPVLNERLFRKLKSPAKLADCVITDDTSSTVRGKLRKGVATTTKAALQLVKGLGIAEDFLSIFSNINDMAASMTNDVRLTPSGDLILLKSKTDSFNAAVYNVLNGECCTDYDASLQDISNMNQNLSTIARDLTNVETARYQIVEQYVKDGLSWAHWFCKDKETNKNVIKTSGDLCSNLNSLGRSLELGTAIGELYLLMTVPMVLETSHFHDLFVVYDAAYRQFHIVSARVLIVLKFNPGKCAELWWRKG